MSDIKTKAMVSVRAGANSSFDQLSLLHLLRRHPGEDAVSLRSSQDGVGETPVALEPLIGGRQVQTDQLAAGDILLATTSQPALLGIGPTVAGPISRPLIFDGAGRVLEAVGNTVQSSTLDSLLENATTVVVCRSHIQLLEDAAVAELEEQAEAELAAKESEEQEARGGQVAASASLRVGKPYTARWLSVAQAVFRLDYPTWRDGRSLQERKQLRTWVGHVNLGTKRSGPFFGFRCSQFVLDVCGEAQVGWTISPYMQVTAIEMHRPLGYVGHLKLGV